MRGLIASLEHQTGIQRDSNEAYTLFTYSMLYLVGRMPAFDLQKQLNPFCTKGISGKNVRLGFIANNYFTLNLKLFAFSCVGLRLTHSKLEALRVKYHVAKRDAQLIQLALEELDWFRDELEAAAIPFMAGVETSTMSGIQNLFTRIYPELYAFVKRITYRKLRFLAKSNNLELSDFHAELLGKCVEAYYKCMPTVRSDLHVLNGLKATAHNHAINMIKAGTSQKSGRLQNVGRDKHNQHQFSMLVVSDNQMRRSELDVQRQDEDESASMAHFELQFSISELVSKYQQHDKRYRLLMILLGTDDDDFTSWLRDNNLCKETESCSDVQLQVSADRYTELAAKYLRVEYAKVLAFLTTIGTALV